MQTPIKLKSGATLTIGLAPFAVGTRLLRTISREMSAVNVEFDLASLKDVGSKDINTLKNVLFQLLASESVELSVMECAKKCLYEGQGINGDTFASEAARPDYLPVMMEVVKANLRPFFSGLDLSLWISSTPKSADPKSE